LTYPFIISLLLQGSHTESEIFILSLEIFRGLVNFSISALVLLQTLNAQMCGSRHRIFRGGMQKTTEEEEGKKNERERGDRRVEEE
jgi:hypothetical protein